VIIIFGSNATFDAGPKGRFFSGYGSKGKSSLELHDITLKNGNGVNANGGAIYVFHGTVEIYNSTFESNQATGVAQGDETQGGAIYAKGANMEIHDSTFQSNTANPGGAIRVYQGTVEIYDSTFESNSGNGGGAIVISAGDLKIYTSTFESNTATNVGGVFGYGGAIYADNGVNVEIHDSTFQSNTATFPNALGGAILIQGSLAAFNCTFHGNTAPAGGAVYVIGNAGYSATATFIGCIFNGNNGTKGHNDITRSDDTSNVTFACANGTVGAPVTMKAGESEIANPPPTSLKCTITNCFCQDSKTGRKCVVDPSATLPCSKCETPGACV
jgi:hypothetical protein